MPLFTLGHSNHTPERLLEIITPFRITHIIDVRSVPYSGRFPHFNRDNLKRLLESRGIVYEWWGDSLGGIRESDETFESIAGGEPFKSAIERLVGDYIGEDTSKVVCLICAERDPGRCHRSMMIGHALRSFHKGGIDLHHILSDGTLIHQSELEERRIAPRSDRAGTMSLFGDTEN